MSTTLITFVGVGRRDAEGRHRGYDTVRYGLHGNRSSPTRFVQTAICEVGTDAPPDRVIALCSTTAQAQTWPELKSALEQSGVHRFELIEVGEAFRPRELWEWFEEMFAHIESGERVVIDLTHGFRAYAIVVSAAVDLLRQAKNVEIEGVYYGALEANPSDPEIIDLLPFFSVSTWADAVAALSRRMDAGPLGGLRENAPRYQQSLLKRSDFSDAVRSFAEAVRNVEANRIPKAAAHIAQLIDENRAGIGPIEQRLLDQLRDFVGQLSAPHDALTRAGPEYFHVQLRLVRLLGEHNLLMSAFTVMRELVGTIGAVAVPNAGFHNGQARKLRRWAAETLIGALSTPEEKWDFSHQDNPDKRDVVECVMRFIERLKSVGVWERLQSILDRIRQIRNGFDHAWMTQSGAPTGLAATMQEEHRKLEQLISDLIRKGIIPGEEGS